MAQFVFYANQFSIEKKIKHHNINIKNIYYIMPLIPLIHIYTYDICVSIFAVYMTHECPSSPSLTPQLECTQHPGEWCCVV